MKCWGQERDIILIEDGQRSLFKLVGKLHEDTYEPIGFELILPMLLNEAKKLELIVPYNELNMFRNLFEEKFKVIKDFHEKYGWNRRHSFWYNIEMLGALTEPSDKELFKLDEKVIQENGSISGLSQCYRLLSIYHQN